jgi:hypothetical protein
MMAPAHVAARPGDLFLGYRHVRSQKNKGSNTLPFGWLLSQIPLALQVAPEQAGKAQDCGPPSPLTFLKPAMPEPEERHSSRFHLP